MGDASTIDAMMTRLMNMRQEWIDTGFPGNIAGKMKDELRALPSGLSDVHRQFFEEIEKELDRGVKLRKAGMEKARPAVIPAHHRAKPEEREYDAELLKSLPPQFIRFFDPELELSSGSAQNAIEQLLRNETGTVNRGRQMLPVRNRCNDKPGHIECFKMNNGLIHGGIVHAPSFTLVCKAFPFFVMKSGKGEDFSTAVVAGVCEQKDKSGNVISRWSTAERLQEYYSSTSIPLPTFPGRWDLSSGIFRGYYFNKWYYSNECFIEMKKQMKNGHCCILESPDDGIPGNIPYNPPANYNANFHHFMRPPTYKTAVENALCDQPAYCSDGFPLCTPYIKVFSPGPNFQKVIVSMIGAFREIRISGRPPQVRYERKAEWYVKTFD